MKGRETTEIVMKQKVVTGEISDLVSKEVETYSREINCTTVSEGYLINKLFANSQDIL